MPATRAAWTDFDARVIAWYFGFNPTLPEPKERAGRRGRVYGRRSRLYDGPRDPGRRRPDPGPLARAWRKARACGA